MRSRSYFLETLQEESSGKNVKSRRYFQSCDACGFQNSKTVGISKCPECGGTLNYRYDQGGKASVDGFPDKDLFGLWKYHKLLPIDDVRSCITLGEGATPLTTSVRLRAELGTAGRVMLKDETQNPTGTYKDRPAAMGVSKAIEIGSGKVIIASDGNAGPATAAYCARAGLKCFVLMPADTPVERNVQTILYGANLILIENSTVSDCIDLITDLSESYEWTHLTTAAAVNPYHFEGTKTIAFEIAEDLEWNTPDWVVMPAGGAGLSAAVWKGFLEIMEAGIITELPRILAVQAEGCAPLVKAFKEGKKKVERWENPSTLAKAISVPFPLDGEQALRAIRDSGGSAISVSDVEMVRAAGVMARLEGIFAEPTGAASVAGLAKALEEGIISKKESVVALVTGTGLKEITSFGKLLQSPKTIGRDISDLKSILDR